MGLVIYVGLQKLNPLLWIKHNRGDYYAKYQVRNSVFNEQNYNATGAGERANGRRDGVHPA